MSACIFSVYKSGTCIYVSIDEPTQSFPPLLLVSCSLLFHLGWIWPPQYVCGGMINAKADLVLTAQSASLWNWPLILVPCFSSLFFCLPEIDGGGSKLWPPFFGENAVARLSLDKSLFLSWNQLLLFLKYQLTSSAPPLEIQYWLHK